ncbi:RINT-1 family protein [Heliocybe sulcata]|uniref:RINT-1 family protein n=1 Tax=Heliocybe sulcata TaxID=5364 RepID=A0A5C3NJP0_9AGAM|nr:RINT-1 family protein [Heliocybe sulcata]
MASADIAIYLSPADRQTAVSRASAFLDSKFATWDDVQASDDLEALVEGSGRSSGELKSRLSVSEANIQERIAETRSSVEAHLHKAQELSLLRHSLADELSYLSNELVSALSDEENQATLLEEVETLHRSLKEVETVKGYVQVIERSLHLSEASVQEVTSSSAHTSISRSSLSNYQKLQEFVASISDACGSIEDGIGPQKLRLVSYVESVRENAWNNIRYTLSAPLLAASEALGWPMRVDYTQASLKDRTNFEGSFLNLLTLQSIGKEVHGTSPSSAAPRTGLYPVQALVQPVSLRFKYHFESSRQTNRLDKPEWYFTHVLNVTTEQRAFMDVVVQRLIDSTSYKGINAWRELVLLLLALPTRKLLRTIPPLLAHPSLLAHTIYQALAFDAALREAGFGLAGTSASKKSQGSQKSSLLDDEDHWCGVSDVILGRSEWFEAWLEGERKFAEDQYNEIISSSDAWLISEDHGDEDGPIDLSLRPTNSARRLKALIEQVTDRYTPLPSYGHRFAFLTSIQLPLLSTYHSRISASLDAFETLSSAFVRAVPGAITVGGGDTGAGVSIGDTRRLTNGPEGTLRLVKALVSARYVERTMVDWGEDTSFLELWTEINREESLRKAAKTNQLLPAVEYRPRDTPDGTVFDELVAQYRRLGSRAEDMIAQQVCGEVESGLKAHWAMMTSPDPNIEVPDGVTVAPTLLAPVALLSSHLRFLQTSLPETTYTVLYRRIASRLCTHILQRAVLYRGRRRLTLQEGQTVQRECGLWIDACRIGPIAQARVEAPWRKLVMASRLIGGEGERWERVCDATFGTKVQADWEEVMAETVGYCELAREEAMQILRLRQDFAQ